jgi:hypothetical protein
MRKKRVKRTRMKYRKRAVRSTVIIMKRDQNIIEISELEKDEN